MILGRGTLPRGGEAAAIAAGAADPSASDSVSAAWLTMVRYCSRASSAGPALWCASGAFYDFESLSCFSFLLKVSQFVGLYLII